MIITLECDYLLTSNKSQVVRFSSTFNLKLCKMMPQGEKTMNFQYENGCKGHQRSICAMALYPKNYITRSTTYMESFIIVSKIAQLSHYAALL